MCWRMPRKRGPPCPIGKTDPRSWGQVPSLPSHRYVTPPTTAPSTGPALIVGGWAIAQLWMFWVAPLLGAVIGGVTYRWLGKEGS